jgi:hypothetical protein
MRRIKNPIYICGNVIAAFVFFVSLNAEAHEPRIIGDGVFSVSAGWVSEPAYEDVVNGFNINISAIDEFGITTPVSTALGDTVDLKAKVLFLETDSSDADILASMMLKDPVSLMHGTLNRYASRFKPTHDGAYGFHVTGTINGVFVDEIFICGGGSQHADGRAFGCAVDPQVFPGKFEPSNTDTVDEAGYKDSDKYSLQ